MEQRIRQVGEIQIGKNIRQIREKKGMMQSELLIALQLQGINMNKDALSRIERGIHHISARELAAIKVILDTTYEELLKETKER